MYVGAPLTLAALGSAISIWNEFATDDLQQIVNNAFIKRLSNLPLAFSTSVWAFSGGDIIFSVDSYYRPLFSALLCINYSLFGAAPWGWHLVNVLIHMGVTALVFVMVRQLIGRADVASVSATLFAIHPVHAESVAWASGITDPMMALFLIPAFVSYVRYRVKGHIGWLAASSLFFLLALLTKETAMSLPVITAGYELLYQSHATRARRLVRALAGAAVFAVPALIYFFLRYHALNTLLFVGGSRYPLALGLKTIPLALLKYFKLLVVPFGYSYQHLTLFVTDVTQSRFVIPAGVIVALAAVILIKSTRDLRFAAIWFIATLIPALAAISQFDPEYIVQERYLYLPSIGFCMAVAIGVVRLSTREWLGVSGRTIASSLVLVLVTVWAIAYVRNIRAWRNTISVYQNCVETAPATAEAHSALSRGYYEAGRVRDAEGEAQKSLELAPEFSTSYLSLSYYAHRAGKLDLAIDYLVRGAAAIPENSLTRHGLGTIYLNLALLYAQRQDNQLAEEAFLKSMQISPRPVAWYYTGQFYFDRDRLEEARQMFEKARDRVPGWFAQVHLKLAKVYDRLGDVTQARSSYQRFLDLAPPDDENRADAEKRLRRL